MKSSRLKAFLPAVLAGFFAILLAVPGAAAPRTVRVGYYQSAGFQEYDEATGEYSGYNYEVLLALAQYTGWQYEFVPTDTSAALTQLADGELDLVGNVSYTDARAEIYEFSTLPEGQNCACLVMLPQRADEIAFEEFDKFSALTVAMVPGRSYSEDFFAYCEKHNCTPTVVYYDTSEAARLAWQNGEVDAYVCTSTYKADYHILAKFHPENFYLATTKGNTELMDELNEALNTITTEDPYFQSNLYNKYYSTMAENNATLTEVEKDYVAQNPTLTVLYDQTEYPISYQNDDGEFAGAIRDVYDEITARTGLNFEFAAADADMYDAAEGAAPGSYLLAEIPYDYKLGARLGVSLTRPFATISCMKVSSRNDEDGGTMAVVEGYYLGELCHQVYGDQYTYVPYEDTKACIEAVKAGKADATCMSSYEYEYYSNLSAYRSLYYKLANGVQYQLCIGVAAGAPPEILSIMGKALNVISTEEIQNILRKTTTTVQKPNLLTLLYRYPQAALVLAVLLALLAGWVALYFVTRRIARRNRLVLEGKNEQLRDAIEQANAANKAKGDFLAQMSHEIRTPMNAIVGMTGLARKTVDDPARTTGYLDKIDASSHMLLSLVNDVLDMSAIENQKLKIAEEPFDLAKLVEGIGDVYTPQCRAKGVELTTETTLSHKTLLGDSLRVNQVLLNLVSNACKFTEAGGHVALRVSEQHPKEGKIYVRFVVEDDGCGMSEGLQKRLFHAFEQEDATTARRHGGSGLGLAITKNLVGLMHGAIEVESAPGEGTTFTVSLPFAAPAQCEAAPAAPAQSYDFTGHRVLLVDDFELNREVAGELLRRVHMAVDEAENGQQAVEKFAASAPGTYDLILMDVQMPVLDGLEAARAIRRLPHPQAGSVPIYAMTANARQEDVAATLNAGMNGHLAKPVNTALLYKLLDNTIKGEDKP